MVVAVDVEPPAAAAREILAVPDPEPALSPALLATAEWMAGYYGAPLGLTLKSHPARRDVGGVAGHRLAAQRVTGARGGLAGEVLAWLEQQGGEAAVHGRPGTQAAAVGCPRATHPG